MAKSRTAQEGLVKMVRTAWSCTEWQGVTKPATYCNAATREAMPLESYFLCDLGTRRGRSTLGF
jgi:hypothetical protein